MVETEKLAKNKQYKTVKLVGGYVEILDSDKIIGYCHNKIHCGALTKNIIKTHECLSKQCRHFEKYEGSPYWSRVKQSLEAKALQKERKKNIVANEVARKAKIINECEQIKQKAQHFANQNTFSIIITRVIPSPIKNGFKYIINYVSDIPYDDWYTYLEIAAPLGKYFTANLNFVTFGYLTEDI